MKCKINRNAAKMIKKLMEEDENKKDKLLRVYITNEHGSHAHYGMMFDTKPKIYSPVACCGVFSYLLLFVRK